jgi:hypothetical protein
MSAPPSGNGAAIPPALYEKLRQVARAREIVHYGELAPTIGIDTENPHFGAHLGRLLEEVNRVEHEQGRPLLSAVVTLKASNIPGAEFFACARELHRYSGKDALGFWVEELQRVHAHWSGD